MIITYKYISYYTIITYHYQLSDLRLLSPIITVKMESSSVAPLAIITRSIVGNNGFIIAYYWPGQPGDVKSDSPDYWLPID